MSEQHTPEPWEVMPGGGGAAPCIMGSAAVQAHGWIEDRGPVSNRSFSARVCDIHGQLDLPAPKANADRIVACVNACAGIPTDALEGGVVGELLHRLEETNAALTFSGEYCGSEDHKLNRAAINKARGE